MHDSSISQPGTIKNKTYYLNALPIYLFKNITIDMFHPMQNNINVQYVRYFYVQSRFGIFL